MIRTNKKPELENNKITAKISQKEKLQNQKQKNILEEISHMVI